MNSTYIYRKCKKEKFKKNRKGQSDLFTGIIYSMALSNLVIFKKNNSNAPMLYFLLMTLYFNEVSLSEKNPQFSHLTR